jgi:hypothetical protein
MKNRIPEIVPEVGVVFDGYPSEVRSKILFLRKIIFKTASSISIVKNVEETLKWGEPSYVVYPVKLGSTVRVGWKPGSENEYAMYFKCTANLVPAFKEKYGAIFNFGGNRSILFGLNDKVPVAELKQCIALAQTYHRNKHLDAAARWNLVDSFLTS